VKVSGGRATIRCAQTGRAQKIRRRPPRIGSITRREQQTSRLGFAVAFDFALDLDLAFDLDLRSKAAAIFAPQADEARVCLSAASSAGAA
jgi:hypothetical protein